VTTPSRDPHRHDPLVIAVEGLCYTGKTTLARSLARLTGTVLIGEYADIAAPPPFPPRSLDDVATALEYFLLLERHRAHAARSAGVPIVVLDRSPLTLIAHECGMAAVGVPSNPSGAAEIYSAAAEAGDILTPDGYLYLAVPDDVTAARQERRGAVAAHLMDPQVRAGIDHACRTWLDGLPPQRYLHLDGTLAPPTLAATTQRWLPGLAASPPVPPWRTPTQHPARTSRRDRTHSVVAGPGSMAASAAGPNGKCP
jgi:deoxyadenosine/deoxycytidine kinase